MLFSSLAAVDDAETARLEFQRTVDFLAGSRAARQRIDAERERTEAEARTVELERQHARENERMLRRLKRLITVSCVLLVLALGAGMLALQQSRQAARAKSLAFQAKSLAEVRKRQSAEALAEQERKAKEGSERTGAVQHLFQANGGTLPPAFHHHYNESGV